MEDRALGWGKVSLINLKIPVLTFGDVRPEYVSHAAGASAIICANVNARLETSGASCVEVKQYISE